mmetsp:Transcript_24841/g.67676  ORF Transcript_24841/g.67676 Transcript_24841/m.67676 type:complete len:92 (-) Transcript_24841:141-416(-)
MPPATGITPLACTLHYVTCDTQAEGVTHVTIADAPEWRGHTHSKLMLTWQGHARPQKWQHLVTKAPSIANSLVALAHLRPPPISNHRLSHS